MFCCSKCKITKPLEDFYKKKNKLGHYHYCKDCFRQVMLVRTRKQAELISSLVGDCCSVCGYNKCDSALELHHLDPKQKEFSLSKSRSYSIEKIKKEISKCILLCANCHREVHSGLLNLGQ